MCRSLLMFLTNLIPNRENSDNYALKQSAFNRLMQTNKKFASTVEKAKANGFRLCPVVPDDYAGMNLDTYADTVQDHLHAVEEKMKEAIK